MSICLSGVSTVTLIFFWLSTHPLYRVSYHFSPFAIIYSIVYSSSVYLLLLNIFLYLSILLCFFSGHFSPLLKCPCGQRSRLNCVHQLLRSLVPCLHFQHWSFHTLLPEFFCLLQLRILSLTNFLLSTNGHQKGFFISTNHTYS